MSGGFSRIKDLVDKEINDGKSRYFSFRKAPTVTTKVGVWFDLSMSPGNPLPKYWFDAPPLTAKAIYQSTDGGIPHGNNVSPSQKYLRKTTLMANVATALPMPMILLDYLLYYPTIDEGLTDAQVMNNTITLPRYTDGDGVQVIAISTATRTGGQSFSFTYTNQDGVSGRQSPNIKQNSTSVVGSLLSTERATAGASTPFLPLQSGDTGVRYIESVTMNGVDTGLFTLILVKPIVTTQINEITAPVEVDYFLDKVSLPKIMDDAYLNYILLPQGSLAATKILGDITINWD